MTTENCVHHWDIEPSVGPTSFGTCKLCDEIRIFENSFGFAGNGNWKIGAGGLGDLRNPGLATMYGNETVYPE